MKKFLILLRNDSILRGNISFAGTFTLFSVNIVIFILAIESWLKGIIITEESLRVILIMVLGMDALFIFNLSLMYFIKEKIFTIKSAMLISIILTTGTFYYFFSELELTLVQEISIIISNSAIIFYPILGLGIILRGFWEDMQERTGGEYSKIDLSYKNLLSNRNILFFAISALIYCLGDFIFLGKFNYITIIILLITGLIIVGCGVLIRKLIDIGVAKYKSFSS